MRKLIHCNNKLIKIIQKLMYKSINYVKKYNYLMLVLLIKYDKYKLKLYGKLMIVNYDWIVVWINNLLEIVWIKY